MIRSSARSVMAVILGLMLALALIIGIELLSSILHPLPSGLLPGDLEVLKTHVVRYPPWASLLVVLGRRREQQPD